MERDAVLGAADIVLVRPLRLHQLSYTHYHRPTQPRLHGPMRRAEERFASDHVGKSGGLIFRGQQQSLFSKAMNILLVTSYLKRFQSLLLHFAGGKNIGG